MRKPSILIPYPGACRDPGCQDVFFYLRPETNGVRTESTLLRVVNRPEYSKRIAFVHLANIPGDFILANRIVEEHYALKIHFARHGTAGFTAHMRQVFSEYFNVPFEQARVVGAFEALRLLGRSEEDLFAERVPESDFLRLNGQTVKRIADLYVVNYDIPALLHKNDVSTDIAVMIFRSTLPYAAFHAMVREMEQALMQEQILGPEVPFSRAFHYSKGPFEQVLDAIGYLYDAGGAHVVLEDISFASYLMAQGMSRAEVLGAIRYPIMRFEVESQQVGNRQHLEDDLLAYTYEDSYAEAFRKLQTAVLSWRMPCEDFRLSFEPFQRFD